MKIPSPKKIFAFIFSILILAANPAFAWDGYDYENKTEVEIGPGNLVREGSMIQFYEAKSDQYYTAKINLMESVASGTRIELKDLDNKQTRIFIMQNE